MAEQLDRDRLVKLLGMLGSAHDGEVIAASRQIHRLGRATGAPWDVLLGSGEDDPQEVREQLEVARDACGILIDENANLRAALTQRGDQADWTPVGTTVITINIGDFCRAARWTLERHAEGAIKLNEFEQTFLDSITRWRKPQLNEKQQAVFDRVFNKIFVRYGLQPPP